ncbi:MAG TPA: hypothetical protein VLB79_02640 [Solirubrobacterales bacterium]|nr:hypothetical protein [Solirubrobacterales bacterium]
MKQLLRRRPSAAMVVAIIALVAALGGTAVAGGILTTKKFKNQALRGPLTYATSTVNVPNTNGPDSQGFQISASCPSGTHPVGGGVKLSNENDQYVNDSYPTAAGWGATIYNGNASALPVNITAICTTVKRTSGSPAG